MKETTCFWHWFELWTTNTHLVMPMLSFTRKSWFILKNELLPAILEFGGKKKPVAFWSATANINHSRSSGSVHNKILSWQMPTVIGRHFELLKLLTPATIYNSLHEPAVSYRLKYSLHIIITYIISIPLPGNAWWSCRGANMLPYTQPHACNRATLLILYC